MMNKQPIYSFAALGLLGCVAILNAMFWQHGTHPAPIAASGGGRTMTASIDRRPEAGAGTAGDYSPVPMRKPASVDMQARELVKNIQKALAARGLYSGAIDGIDGPKTRAAIAAFERKIGISETGAASRALLDQLRYSALLETLAKSRPASPAKPAAAQRVQAPVTKADAIAPDPVTVTAAILPRPAPRNPIMARRMRPSAREVRRPETVQEDVASEDMIEKAERKPLAAGNSAGTALDEIMHQVSAEEPAAVSATPVREGSSDVRLVQSGLSELGYSPGRVDGYLGGETRDAIREFERDRGLPVSGEVSAAVMRELRKVTGVSVLSSG